MYRNSWNLVWNLENFRFFFEKTWDFFEECSCSIVQNFKRISRENAFPVEKICNFLKSKIPFHCKIRFSSAYTGSCSLVRILENFGICNFWRTHVSTAAVPFFNFILKISSLRFYWKKNHPDVCRAYRGSCSHVRNFGNFKICFLPDETRFWWE